MNTHSHVEAAVQAAYEQHNGQGDCGAYVIRPMRSYRQKLDQNHIAIRNYLTAHGCEVLELMKPLDLLCHYKGTTVWIEAKIPGSSAKYTAVQIKFIAHTKMPVIIATDEAEAFRMVRDRVYLSQRQKDALAALLAINGKEYYQPSEIEKVLNK